jgi:sugar transferase EpsL
MIKRTFDFVVAACSLVVLAPVLLLLAAVVACRLGRPVLFRQVRTGLHERTFCLIKFRSMSEVRDAQGVLLSEEQRTDRFGRLLRSSSLDELPSLWCVLCGDLSLVGPRPLLPEYVPLYSAEQRRRHMVRPGITGWAQVNGRNAATWPERLAMDVWYVDHQSFWLDARILWMTVSKVLARDGISPEGQLVMPRFLGNDDQDHSRNC